MRAPAVEQHDLQGNVLRSYLLPYAWYAFVRVEDAAAGRRWLGELAQRVTSDAPPRGDETLNVALGFDGLRALGVPGRLLASFPEEFRRGMARDPKELGDTGQSHPDSWDEGLRPGDEHVLVTTFATTAAKRDRARAELVERIDSDRGLRLGHGLDAALLDHPLPGAAAHEHFGFADGLSQPSIDDPRAGGRARRGQGTPDGNGGWKNLAAGEFVLGYVDEDGVVADAPGEPLRRNGSFTVVRKLHQDVALFNRYLRDAARAKGEREELLAAKIVGRWRDGTPLVLSPDAEKPDLVADRSETSGINDFTYADDRMGLRCPIGAHIRRANPRDALGWGGQLGKRHRMIRRGMPYGERLATSLEDDGADRGLMFVCYQASIARQFEVVQGQWLNDGDAFRLGADKDMLTANEDPDGKMTIQGRPPRFLSPLAQFVTTKGGGYYLTPGIAALRAVAAGLDEPA